MGLLVPPVQVIALSCPWVEPMGSLGFRIPTATKKLDMVVAVGIASGKKLREDHSNAKESLPLGSTRAKHAGRCLRSVFDGVPFLGA